MNPSRIGTIGALMLGALLFAQSASAQCTRDTECKRDRVCENGRCVDPPASPPAVQPVTGGCTSNADCKGGRVCNNGVCVQPSAPAVAPVAPQPAAPPPQPAAPPPQPAGPPPQYYVPPGPAPAAQPATANELELQDLQSRRRIGRSLLITGIVAFVVGGAAQAGWALEECWTTGTNISGYQEDCELTTLGSSLVISGFVLLALGTTSIIIGAVQLKKARSGLRRLQMAQLSVTPFVDPRERASGLALQLRF